MPRPRYIYSIRVGSTCSRRTTGQYGWGPWEPFKVTRRTEYEGSEVFVDTTNDGYNINIVADDRDWEIFIESENLLEMKEDG